MRIANRSGRLVLLVDEGAVDVERASDGRFSSDPQAVYSRWEEFQLWAASVDSTTAAPYSDDELGAPVPRPGQVFAIGLNYAEHAAEANLAPGTAPVVFTKFPASIAGPYDTIEHPGGSMDFEVELVVVIGRAGRGIDVADAWDHVAGFTLGQDLTEREIQWTGTAPQFSLGKSFAGFSPIGPTVASLDEFDNYEDVALSCELSGKVMQSSSTRNLIFTIPVLIAYLSAFVELRPGDLIFSGTPSGIGFTRDPKELITLGDELVSCAEVIGEMRHRFSESRYAHPSAALTDLTHDN